MTPPTPILSIIIPSRNRADYAKACLRSALSIDRSDFEIIVQDNSDEPILEDFVANDLNDSRIHYRYTSDRMDVIQNFTQATERANGEYICFIGDDDGVTPEIVDAASWAYRENYDALDTTRPAQFWWPDIRHRVYGDRFAGSLEIRPFTGTISFPDPHEELFKCARSGGQQFFNLPKVYYGLVRRTCLEQVRGATGEYFPGPSPDLAGAVAVASYVDRMCLVDYPLVLPGSSKASTAGMGVAGRHIGRLEDWPHLPKDKVANWSQLVPAFFSGRTIWGEDVVQALKATGRDDVLKEFDVSLLHAHCVVFHPDQAKKTLMNLLPALRTHEESAVVGIARFAAALVKAYARRGRSSLLRFKELMSLDESVAVKQVGTIEEAVSTLVAHLQSVGLSFAQSAGQVPNQSPS